MLYLDERELNIDLVRGGWNDNAKLFRENGGEALVDYRTEFIVRGFQETPRDVYLAEYDLQKMLIGHNLYTKKWRGYGIRIASNPIFVEMREKHKWLVKDRILE